MPDNINITSNGDVVAFADSFGGFPRRQNIGDPGHNDTYDAFKHTYGSAKLTEAFGNIFSKWRMDLREEGTPIAEQNMDKWNNNVGREEYYRWKKAYENGDTTDSLGKWIYDVVNEGNKTINNLSDTRIWVEPLSSWDKIQEFINDLFTQAQDWIAPPIRIDPLTLDLDGDGIETTAQSGWNGVLFDHNNDDKKTATGWLSGDDGFLVMDRNGNGTIDNGTELFGDNTQLSNGDTASDGFAALADIDSNQDGLIDVNDSAFANLRVWQDKNQDGVSQPDELKTLDQLGIASLSTIGTASGASQNGNVITHTGTFTKTDGSIGQTGNLDLASSTFYTDYIETNTLSDADLARPDMHGSGSVYFARSRMRNLYRVDFCR